jgi:hypothetical protein
MSTSTSSNRSDLVAKFQHLFTGIGKLKDYKQKLHLNPSIQPVAQKPRRVPFHLRKQVSAQIEELEALDIIERASDPTSWVLLSLLEVTIARKVLPHPQRIKGSMHNLLNKRLFI